MSDAHKHRTTTDIGGICQTSATVSNTLLPKKDEQKEQSVEKIVVKISSRFVPPGKMSDEELYHLLQSDSVTLSHVAHSKALGTPTDTRLLKKGSLLLLHLLKVSAKFLAILEVLKRAKASGSQLTHFIQSLSTQLTIPTDSSCGRRPY